jgi:hypothetical protein
MNKLDEFNKRLLVVLGLSPETAQIIMERIEEAEGESARLRKALEWVRDVNACDYEYRKIARDALANSKMSQPAPTNRNDH